MNAEKINCMRTLIKGAITNLWADAAGREETHREVDQVCDLALKAIASAPEAQAQVPKALWFEGLEFVRMTLMAVLHHPDFDNMNKDEPRPLFKLCTEAVEYVDALAAMQREVKAERQFPCLTCETPSGCSTAGACEKRPPMNSERK